MFRALSNFLHRTPWWAMALLGLGTIAVLGLFTVPFHLISLEKSGDTPEMNRAIKRQVDAAFADSALNVAEEFVEAFRKSTKDPERRQELDNALEEIARARDELKEVGRVVKEARTEAERAAREASTEAERAIKDAAREARDSAYESLIAAREAAVEGATTIVQSQRDALRAFRDAGLKDARVEKELERSVKAAEDTLAKARKRLERARNEKARIPFGFQFGTDKVGMQVNFDDDEDTPKAEAAPAAPVAAKEGKATPAPALTPAPKAAPAPTPKAMPGMPVPPNAPAAPFAKAPGVAPVAMAAPLAPLPPEVRADINEKVAGDFYRLGIGAGLIMLFIPLFIMALIAKFFIDRARGALRVAEMKKKEADYHSMHRQVTEAKLQALQAQVEPHFLYNTLANVQALTEADPAQANKMVEHLIQYLRSALPKMRETTSTVGQEMELVRAYLNILKMRMGARLEFAIDVPDDVAKLAFPPLMLPSLVENAIQHGLEPRKEGGRIDIIASRVNGLIRLEVKDTGRGFGVGTAGGGVGLTNIRERLLGLFGAAGKLTLTENQPSGVIATLEVPEHVPGAVTAEGNVPAQPAAPRTMSAKVWGGVKTVHGVWARFASFTFMALMIVLGVAFGVAIVGTFTGWLPVHIGNVQLQGAQGAAVGTAGLVLAFGALALVVLVLVALFYGLGVMFAGLLVFIPIVIVVSLFPVLSPFILIGLAIWWYVRHKRKQREMELPTLKV